MPARVHRWFSPNWHPSKSLLRYIFNISNTLQFHCQILKYSKFNCLVGQIFAETDFLGLQLFCCVNLNTERESAFSVPVSGFCIPPQLLLSAVFEYIMWLFFPSEYLDYYKCIQWHSQQIKTRIFFMCQTADEIILLTELWLPGA